MQRRLRTCLVMIAGTAFAQDLHFKTRTLSHPAGLRPQLDLQRQPADTSSIHKLILYDHPPDTEEVQALLREGISVVAALPDNAIVVSVPGGIIKGAETAVWVGRIDPADKLSPALTPALTPGGLAAALVEFHSDVTVEQQDTVAGAVGVELRHPAVLQSGHAIVTGSMATLRGLAEYDEVAYIFPADPALSSEPGGDLLLTCAGMLTTNGKVGQYATIVHGWNPDADGFAHLTYLFGSVTPKVPSLIVKSEILRALNEWAKVTNLTFQQGPNPAGARNIIIKFVSGAHGDSYPFDGNRNSLAHTFYPVPVNPETIAGDMHLDADESWRAGGDTDIFSVALHEAGHAIGLGHSDKPGDVMYPYYRNRAALAENDIRAAQTLYGIPLGAAPGPVTQPVEPVSGGTGAGTATTPLRLTVDNVPVATRSESATLSGTVSGGKDPVSVQWQTAGGAAGRALVNTGTSSRAWSISSIPLITGENTITVSALDSANQSASASMTITRQAASAGSVTRPVSISIKTPAPIVTTVSTPTLSMAGISTGGAGITRVTWQTSAGAAGVAVGTTSWLAGGVPLLRGTNTIVVRAWDAKGTSAWASMVVIRR